LARRLEAALSSRTLDIHISRIRDKLGPSPSNGWRPSMATAIGRRNYARHIDDRAAAMPGIAVAAVAV
jgi:hypothetical protein